MTLTQSIASKDLQSTQQALRELAEQLSAFATQDNDAAKAFTSDAGYRGYLQGKASAFALTAMWINALLPDA